MRYGRIIGGMCLLICVIFNFSVVAQETQKKLRDDEIISLDSREKSFADIIEGIREETGKNIIFDEEVRDIYVTIRLVNIPWRKALEIIAKEHNCLVEDLQMDVVKVSKPPVVTMEFEGADVRDIINQIATIANKNIVISEQVKGTVSLRLKNVPWQDALNAIIKTRGYIIVKENEGRILRVVPPEEIETQLETQIYQLRFIRPKSLYIAKMETDYVKLEDNKSQGQQGKDNLGSFSLLHALSAVVTPGKGKITYNSNTNTLVMTDVKPKIDKMIEIIKELDKEPKQVFVDIKFVTTQNSDIFDFGVDAGENGFRATMSLGSMLHRLPFSLGKTGWEDEIAVFNDATGFPNPTQANEAAENPITFGSLDFTQTSFTLKLLKRDQRSKVVQAPKLIALDHHEATIFVGRTIAFARTEIVQNDSGVPSVEVSEAPNSPARQGFQILIVPHILPGTNKIQMTIIPANDQLTGTTSPAVEGFNRFEAGGTSIDLPELTQQVVVSHMILESGQTAVLGGLLQISQSEVVQKIPFLGDIPLIGYFFKGKTVQKNKQDMYIFVTPRIIQSSETTKDRVKTRFKEKIEKKTNQFKSIWQEDKK